MASKWTFNALVEAATTIATTISRPPRNVVRGFPVGLHIRWFPKTSGGKTAVCFGKIVTAASGKIAAEVVEVSGTYTPSGYSSTSTSVLHNQMRFPKYFVGEKVQVVDEHTTVSNDGDRTYWYDTTVVKVITRGMYLSDYIVKPSNPTEQEQQINLIKVHHIWSSRGLDESTPLFFEGTTSRYVIKILTPDLGCLRRIEFSHTSLNNV